MLRSLSSLSLLLPQDPSASLFQLFGCNEWQLERVGSFRCFSADSLSETLLAFFGRLAGNTLSTPRLCEELVAFLHHECVLCWGSRRLRGFGYACP
jgi:hypothetical protein